jgi:hypothetical protein
MNPKNPKRTIEFVCPGCLTSFRLDAEEVEKAVPKCNYCMLPLEKVRNRR